MFTGRMPFLTPNQQCQSTKLYYTRAAVKISGQTALLTDMQNQQKHVRVEPPLLDLNMTLTAFAAEHQRLQLLANICSRRRHSAANSSGAAADD